MQAGKLHIYRSLHFALNNYLSWEDDLSDLYNVLN